MNKKLLIGSLIAVGAIVFGIGFFRLSEKPLEKYTGPVEKIKFGVEISMLPSAVWVAENKGYFQKEGLEIEIKEFDSGRTALSTMLTEGGLDMVTVAQTPVMFNSFSRNDYAILAAMVYSDNDVKVLGRQDKGIKNASDLKGKRIGITKSSSGHFFLGLLLTHNGLGISDVETVDLKAAELAQALADGRVEAISTWEPHISNAQKLLGEKAVLLESKGIFREDFYFVSNKDFIKNHPQTLERFLKAIEKGEEFISKNREESVGIVAKRIKTDREIIARLWDIFEFELMLDQSVLMCLEDEARWAIKNNLVSATKLPNYLDFIYLEALEAVKPEAVTVIR